MFAESHRTPRSIVWTAILFVGLAFTISWWHWWTFQYGSFDLAFYVQALWLALRGKWMVSLLNVPLMGNHAEPDRVPPRAPFCHLPASDDFCRGASDRLRDHAVYCPAHRAAPGP